MLITGQVRLCKIYEAESLECPALTDLRTFAEVRFATQTGHSPFLKAVIDARSFDHLVGADRRIPSEEIQRIATEGASTKAAA